MRNQSSGEEAQEGSPGREAKRLGPHEVNRQQRPRPLRLPTQLTSPRTGERDAAKPLPLHGERAQGGENRGAPCSGSPASPP